MVKHRVSKIAKSSDHPARSIFPAPSSGKNLIRVMTVRALCLGPEAHAISTCTHAIKIQTEKSYLCVFFSRAEQEMKGTEKFPPRTSAAWQWY